jgi:putative transposase
MPLAIAVSDSRLLVAARVSAARRLTSGIFPEAALRPVPEPIRDPGEIARLDIRRRDRFGGVIHEYHRAA